VGVQLEVISEMPVEAQQKRLAVCTVIWGVHGAKGMILAMPVNGALVPECYKLKFVERNVYGSTIRVVLLSKRNFGWCYFWWVALSWVVVPVDELGSDITH
jgi:hypothetical protein